MDHNDLISICPQCGNMKIMPEHFNCMYQLNRHQLKELLNKYINTSIAISSNEYTEIIKKILPPINTFNKHITKFRENNEIYELMYRTWWIGLDDPELEIGFKSWTLPQSYNIIKELLEFINGGTILDICSGSGFQSAILSAFGCKVIATDLYTDYYDKSKIFAYIDIEKLSTNDALEKYGNQVDVLMVIWGVGFPDYQNLKYFKGNRIISIGEPLGGCTSNGILDCIGTDDIDENSIKINQEWELLQLINIETWFGIHDKIKLFIRK